MIKRHLQLLQAAAAAEIWHRVQPRSRLSSCQCVRAFVVGVVVGADAAASFAIKCMVKSRQMTRPRTTTDADAVAVAVAVAAVDATAIGFRHRLHSRRHSKA